MPEIINGQPSVGHKFVDRGDPSVLDFTANDFTTDDCWYDLDLSAIIPKGSKLFAMRIVLTATTANAYFELRKKGLVNDINENKIYTIVASMPICYNILVPCDSNSIIQYKASPSTWLGIDIVVGGWFV